MTERKPDGLPSRDTLRDMQRQLLSWPEVSPLVRIASVLMFERLIAKRGGKGVSIAEISEMENLSP